MIVKFVEVGRGRLDWEQELPNIEEATVIDAVRRRVVLMSREVSATYEAADNVGIIYAGAHMIGTFRVVNQGPAEDELVPMGSTPLSVLSA